MEPLKDKIPKSVFPLKLLLGECDITYLAAHYVQTCHGSRDTTIKCVHIGTNTYTRLKYVLKHFFLLERTSTLKCIKGKICAISHQKSWTQRGQHFRKSITMILWSKFPPPTASICALHSRGIRKVCALLTSVVSSYINSIPTVESAERQKHVVHPFVEISQFFGLFFSFLCPWMDFHAVLRQESS